MNSITISSRPTALQPGAGNTGQPSLNYSLSSQSHNEFWLSAVSFQAVAGRTQQLQVVRVICFRRESEG